MLPTRLLKAPPQPQIPCNLLISLDLARHQRDRLFRQPLRQTYNAVEVADQVVSGVDGGGLGCGLETDGAVDLDVLLLTTNLIIIKDCESRKERRNSARRSM